jgi:hypothetical protein
MTLTVAALVTLGVGTVGCSSSSHRKPAPTSPRPVHRTRPDVGLAAVGDPRMRVCGYMTVGPYTASDVEMHGFTCPQTAGLVKTYLSGGSLPPGLNTGRASCDAKLRPHAPLGTQVDCAVTIRGTSGAIFFFFSGGRPGHGAPQPRTGLDPPGDERDFGQEAGHGADGGATSA